MPWLLGLIGLAGAMFVVGSVLAYLSTIWMDPNGLYPVRDASLASTASEAVVLVSLAALVFYVLVVPLPAGRIGLTQHGVVLPAFGREQLVTWDRLHVWGRMLYSFSGPRGLSNRWKLTADQSGLMRAAIQRARSVPTPS